MIIFTALLRRDNTAVRASLVASATRSARYCGAIIYFASQKERVKALSEARLDRSYSTSVTELMTLKASKKPVSLTVFWACGDMFIR